MGARPHVEPLPSSDEPHLTLHEERREANRGSKASLEPGRNGTRPLAGVEEDVSLEDASLEEAASQEQAMAPVDDWERARTLFESDALIEAPVIGYNKGGLLVTWRGLQGFVPASQLLGVSKLHVQSERVRQLRDRQGETIQLKIIELNEGNNRLIFSERATQVSATAKERLLRRLSPGDKCSGTVTTLADFGAFVDLGGVEGLIHISQLSWRRLTHPSDAVKPGQKVNVLVLDVDVERGRVALSRKQLREDPWNGVEQRYHVAQVVEGTITSVSDFGAFTLLEEGLEGLIHVTEMGNSEVEHPDEVVQKGDRVQTRVLSVNEAERRLALSLLQVNPQTPSS